MHDFFSEANGLECIPIKGGELHYKKYLPLGITSEKALHELIEETPWQSETIVMWGKNFQQPRLVAWYGDAGLDYTYSGIRLNPIPWTKLLLDIKAAVELISGTSFNSVLLNYYRDNRDSMGFHSDDERELGEQPVIASLSLGCERTFLLKHKVDKNLKPLRIKLGSGSFLLMKGETQRNWKHGINKETQACGPRVNLTFRNIKK